jgi:uncharacterized membrane protein YdjX (TVP38/TMEM64 family)
MSAADPTPPNCPAARFKPARILPLVVVAAVSGIGYAMGWQHELFPALLARRAAVEGFVAEHWIAALAAYTATYFAVAAFSVPGAAFLTIFGGLVFGTIVAGLATLVGATAGAIVIFLIAKSAIGDWLVRRAGPRVERIAAGFRADSFNYLLFLRLVPFFPFWLVNLVPALCGVPLGTFIAATALGIIPGTFAFAFLGASLDSAIKTQNAKHLVIAGLVALGVLALLPVAIKRLKAWRAPSEASGRT